MSLRVGQPRRPRSSTTASRGLNVDEESSDTAALLRRIHVSESIDNAQQCNHLAEACQSLRSDVAAHASAKDTFRHGNGFQYVLELLQNLRVHSNLDDKAEAIEPSLKLVRECLMLLTEALSGHRGNEKYFRNHLDGWTALQDSVSAFHAVVAESLSVEAHNHLASFYDSLLGLALDEQNFVIVRDRLAAAEGSDNAAAGELAGTETVHHGQSIAIAVRLAIDSSRKDANESPASNSALPALLDAVAAIATLRPRNAVAIWQTGVLSDFIALALNPRKKSEIRSKLQAVLWSMSDLGVAALDDVASLFLKACDSDDARELLLQMLQRSKSPSYIQFDLTLLGYASVELPSLPRAFPPSTSYTLTAWMRFDEFDPDCHTTIFGAFDASQSCFVLAYLEKDSHQLILQTSVRSARPSVRFKSTRFASRKWYHVAVVHRRANADPRASPAMLFIDGEFAEQVKCAYPEAPPEMQDKSTTASPGPDGPRRSKPVQAFFGTPHDLALRLGCDLVKSKWSLASAHLYSAALSDEFLAVHYRLGPRYAGNLQDCLGPLLTYRASAELNRYNELLHPDKSDKSDIVTATEGRGSDVIPEHRILLSISPTSVIVLDGTSGYTPNATYELDRKALPRYQTLAQKTNAIAINAATPTINEAIGRSYGSAVLTGNPVVAVPKALDDASWCLAGCLPLVVGLLEAAASKNAFLQATRIFFECVKDNWRISEAMEKGHGFGVFAMIVREKFGFETGLLSTTTATRKPCSPLNLEDRQTLPIELLQLILQFVGYDSKTSEKSMIVNPMAYRVLLIDFDTWRRCDIDTQKLYYAQFVHLVERNRHSAFNHKRLIRMRVVKKLIEALKSEEILEVAVEHMVRALDALIDHSSAHNSYRELAMYVAFGLQDDRSVPTKSVRSMSSMVQLRQRAATWARRVRGSRPSTPGGAQSPAAEAGLSRTELAVRVLTVLADIVCDDRTPTTARRFAKAVPNRWMLHLLAETDARVVTLTLRIISRSLIMLGPEFKSPFAEKNGGFSTLKARLKTFWRSTQVWNLCFATLFGRNVTSAALDDEFSLFSLVEKLSADDGLAVRHPEMLPVIMGMLEAALRTIVRADEPSQADTKLVSTIIQLLTELYTRSTGFRDFANNSRYMQELLFVLYPVVVGSDRLSAETELQAEKDALSFRGEEVIMRPHSNSLGERPPSVRSLNMDSEKRTPSPLGTKRVEPPKRLSSFLLVNGNSSRPKTPSTRLNAAIAPKSTEPVKLNVGNSVVEALLEVGTGLFLDQVCTKEKYAGLGLFLKVPPGFREHQAYFESYVLVHTLSQLWNHLQLNQSLLLDTRVLGNLSKFSVHMAEAVFEGWFIDGAQPLLDFTGKLLDYLQQPDIASQKNVRLCAQSINTVRVVFLRVMLLRLSELDETTHENDAIAFLDQMNYWQTILFSSENQETPFIRLICFLLYMKLTSTITPARLAAARLWRTMLVQKPAETATLLTFAMGSEQRHLSTGFMKLVSSDDEEFLVWVDQNRSSLDAVFIDALAKSWEDFVNEENRRNEESAKNRLSKRREKLRMWQSEESGADDFTHRYEVSTHHWRSNVHAQERVKLQRSMQDQQENINILLATFTRLERFIGQPCGLRPFDGDRRWQLDETEAVNRMRMRTLPDSTTQKDAYQPKRKYSERKSSIKLAINTQVPRPIAEDIMSSFPNTPAVNGTDGVQEQIGSARPRSESMSNSQLLEGAFEMIEDPKADEDGLVEDKNRKVMTSLQRGDMVQQLYNMSRIVGLEACEGLLVIGKKCLYLQDNFFQRSDGEIVSVAHAPDDERDPYVQLLSGKDVGSERTKHSVGDSATRHWTWTEVLSISKRRFLLRDVGVEVFFTDGRSYLLICMSSKVRDDLYSAITGRAPHVHNASTVASEDAWRLDNLRNPEEAPQSLGSKFANVFGNTASHAATKKWVKGEMSNFQYLMLVNTMAGRSFNDLTQYPVFPWVLADYKSDELDLTNPKTFRDLSKPMGCQTAAREAEYKDRYKQFAEMADENAPPFNYGTHYSSAMIVTSYLIRLQPFVQSYLLLQGGSFDHADRLFDSIGKAWLSCSRDNMTDVRELTPEFYYLPEFLTNINKYDFGVKQGGGEAVNDIELPPWAKGDPHLFVTKHREALESPYVSEHLHLWIDLVFGFKQRGEAAVEATNVFQHLSYQGAKDLDTITDPVERLATIGIIHSFGQTPHQVFQRPHAAREVERHTTSRLDTMAESLIRIPSPLFESDEKVSVLTFSPTQERLLCTGPCKLNMLPACDRFLQWGFADHSLRFFSSNTKRLLGLYENTHIGPIAAATFVDSKTLVTAGADCTLAIWTVAATRDVIEIHPKTYLFGHRTSITQITASRVFSTLLSVSADGQVLMWDLNRFDCIRVLRPAGGALVQACKISNVSGHIMICCQSSILLYSLNGHLLLDQKVCESPIDQIMCCAFYEGAANEWLERELLFTGHTHGIANIWALTTLSDGAWHLQLVKRLNHTDANREDGGNTSAAITALLPMANAVYTGDEEGRVWEWDVIQRQGNASGRGR